MSLSLSCNWPGTSAIRQRNFLQRCRDLLASNVSVVDGIKDVSERIQFGSLIWWQVHCGLRRDVLDVVHVHVHDQKVQLSQPPYYLVYRTILRRVSKKALKWTRNSSLILSSLSSVPLLPQSRENLCTSKCGLPTKWT